ncbi:hypothetical protein [Halolamina sp.]|jgi:hypothetical protein|uniref:hypothetical protein n=1 Tax=Halolamina sp. TaxID=1940283 RepID=UPI000223B6D4|nr:hypothetical protein Halar_1861 [halophilic archaeon DL31]
MSQETQRSGATEPNLETGTGSWISGMIGGLAGGALMGVMISVMMAPVIEAAIPGLYGLSGGLAGWIVHMSHSAVLGVVFAGIMEMSLGRYSDNIGAMIGIGAVYGIVLWAVLAALVMPIWLGVVGFPQAPPFPNFALPGSLPAHIGYGVVLGAVYPYVKRMGI